MGTMMKTARKAARAIGQAAASVVNLDDESRYRAYVRAVVAGDEPNVVPEELLMATCRLADDYQTDVRNLKARTVARRALDEEVPKLREELAVAEQAEQPQGGRLLSEITTIAQLQNALDELNAARRGGQVSDVHLAAHGARMNLRTVEFTALASLRQTADPRLQQQILDIAINCGTIRTRIKSRLTIEQLDAQVREAQAECGRLSRGIRPAEINYAVSTQSLLAAAMKRWRELEARRGETGGTAAANEGDEVALAELKTQSAAIEAKKLIVQNMAWSRGSEK